MGAKWKGGEPLVDAVTAKLQTGLAARIETINADFNDGITVNPPAPSSYYKSGIQSIPGAPAVIVQEGPMSVLGQEAVHSPVTDTIIGVYLLDQDADRQTLGKRLQRLARATIECLWDDSPQEQLNGVGPWDGHTVGYRVMPKQTLPGRVFEPTADDEYRGFYIVIFSVQQAEPGA